MWNERNRVRAEANPGEKPAAGEKAYFTTEGTERHRVFTSIIHDLNRLRYPVPLGVNFYLPSR